MAFNKNNKLGNNGKNYSNRSMTPREKLLTDKEVESLNGTKPKWTKIGATIPRKKNYKQPLTLLTDSIPNGKYEGKTVIDVILLDPSHIIECLKKNQFKVTSKLKAKIISKASLRSKQKPKYDKK